MTNMADNTYENAIKRPFLEFEHGVFSTYDIFQKCPLPVVVQCDTSKRSVPVERANFNFDLTQPILFYRKRKIQKIPAKSLYIDEDTNSFKEIGDPLLIPEDYKGYFAVIRKRNSSGPVDDHVPHFSRIEDLASSDTDQFLIGGQNKVNGFHVINTPEESQSHHQRTLFPGDVLRKGKIFVGETKRKGKLFRKGSLVSEKYLSCIDEADREVLIPFAQTGLFYALSNQSGSKMACPILQMENIVAQKVLPCVVKLVYGRVPTTPCCFSGILQLEKSHLEQSIIAATIMNFKNILLEIPTICDLDFFVAINNKDLLSHEGYSNAVKLCREKAQRYMTNIKVCYNANKDSTPQHTHADPFTVQQNEIPQIPRQLTPPSPCSKTSLGYIPMNGKQTTEQFDSSCIDSEGYVKMDSTPTLRIPQPYMLKLFLENECIDMPIYDRRAFSEAQGARQSVTEPPDSPPPPPPCRMAPPAPCKGSPTQDSGISDDISSSDFRRPSTFIYSEKEQFFTDDITYDIPKIPKRRESAPPDLNISMPIDPISEPKPSSILPIMEETRDVSASKDSVFEHSAAQSTDSEKPTLDSNDTPQYINVEGLREIAAKLERISEARTSGDENTAACFRWLSDPEHDGTGFYESSLHASVDLSPSSSMDHLSYSQNNLDACDQTERIESQKSSDMLGTMNNESIPESNAATSDKDNDMKENHNPADDDRINCNTESVSLEIQEENKDHVPESNDPSTSTYEVVGETSDQETVNDDKSNRISSQQNESVVSDDCTSIQSIGAESESKEMLKISVNETKPDGIVEENIDALNSNIFESNSDITNAQSTESESPENDNKQFQNGVDESTKDKKLTSFENGNISECQIPTGDDDLRSSEFHRTLDTHAGMGNATSKCPDNQTTEAEIDESSVKHKPEVNAMIEKSENIGELKQTFRAQERHFTYILSALDNANRSKSMDEIPCSHRMEPTKKDSFSCNARLPNHQKSASESDKNGENQNRNLNANIEKYRERSKTLWSVLRSRQHQSQTYVPRRGSLSNIDQSYFLKSKIIARQIESEQCMETKCMTCKNNETTAADKSPCAEHKGKVDYPAIAPKPKDIRTIARRRSIAVPCPRTTTTVNRSSQCHNMSPLTKKSHNPSPVTTNSLSQNSEMKVSTATGKPAENSKCQKDEDNVTPAFSEFQKHEHASSDQNEKPNDNGSSPIEANEITPVQQNSPPHGDKQAVFLQCMSVEELDNALKEVGVRRESREYIRNRNIDGKQLIAMDIDSLGDELTDVGRIDLTKIAMVIRTGSPTYV